MDENVGISGTKNSNTDAFQQKQRYAIRRLAGAFDTIQGNQLPDVKYCDKNRFYTGRYASCFSAMSDFFANDVALLHANLTFADKGADLTS